MAPRPFNDRTVAHKWAVAQRPDKADGLCSSAKRAHRRADRGGRRRAGRRVAAAVAAAVGADPGEVRVALDEALAREKNGAAVVQGRAATGHGAEGVRTV